MSKTRFTSRRLSAGLLAALLAPALTGGQPVLAQDQIAELITGAIQPAERPAALPTNPAGSAEFRSALALLASGKAAEAYALARGFSDSVERRTIQWAAIRFGNGAVDYMSVARFAEDAPHFDAASNYKRRLEQSLMDSNPSGAEVIARLGGQMPILLDAQIALAEAYVADGQVARAGRIARDIWVTNFLTKDDEAKVLSRLGTLLTTADHWERAVHLLMHDRATGTERILDRLTPAQKTLARARISVSRHQDNAQTLIDRVDPSLRDHPLFYFTRAQLARDKGALKSAVAFLDHVTRGDVPDAAEFWYERRLIVRRALAAGDAALAYKAAASYTQGPEGRLVEARFHAGWIALAYLGDAATAKQQFEQMSALSTLPESVAQAQYWLGRALAALGDAAGSARAFQRAAQYDSLYYGQLAREQLGLRAVEIRSLPDTARRAATFDQKELVRAVRLLIANKRKDMAEPLVGRLAYSITDPGDFVLAARLAQEIDAHHLAILIADIADKKGIPLDLFHFPKDGLPKNVQTAAIDNAAVYAIARQESRFDVDAVSRSGARGLMQLMPATAKEVAGKVGVSYSASRLTNDANYNILLGSTYLASQLERFDGSLVLAAAAYNAGAGNVNKWIKAFGDPRSDTIDPVSWIETIPFAETRKYVQRVMGNYLVYRARLGDQSMTMEQALRAIAG